MHFLSVEAYPKPTNPAYGDADGAFVAVFVNESGPGAAEEVARAFIEEAGWDVERIDESHTVELESFPPGDPGRDKFEQALIDGIVATFHTWPIGAPDDDEEVTDGGAA